MFGTELLGESLEEDGGGEVDMGGELLADGELEEVGVEGGILDVGALEEDLGGLAVGLAVARGVLQLGDNVIESQLAHLQTAVDARIKF